MQFLAKILQNNRLAHPLSPETLDRPLMYVCMSHKLKFKVICRNPVTRGFFYILKDPQPWWMHFVKFRFKSFISFQVQFNSNGAFSGAVPTLLFLCLFCLFFLVCALGKNRNYPLENGFVILLPKFAMLTLNVHYEPLKQLEFWTCIARRNFIGVFHDLSTIQECQHCHLRSAVPFKIKKTNKVCNLERQSLLPSDI